MTTTFARKTQLVGTEAEWTAQNTPLLDGEFGVESDTRRIKLGPGAWNDLPYIGEGGIVPWSATVQYSNGEVVLVDNDIYQSFQDSNTGNDPNTDDGTWWRPISIRTTNLVLNVPARFVNLEAAFDFLRYASVSAASTITINIAAGDYTGWPTANADFQAAFRTRVVGAALTDTLPTESTYATTPGNQGTAQAAWNSARSTWQASTPHDRGQIELATLRNVWPTRIINPVNNIAITATRRLLLVQDLLFQGDRTGARGMIYVSGGGFVSMDRCAIHAGNYGLELFNARSSITDVHIVDCINDAIRLDAASALAFTNAYVMFNSSYGVWVENNSTFTGAGLIIRQPGAAGIYVNQGIANVVAAGGADGAVIEYGLGEGVKIFGGGWVQLDNVKCWGHELSNVESEDGVLDADLCTISGSAQHGVRLIGGSSKVGFCTIAANVLTGVRLERGDVDCQTCAVNGNTSPTFYVQAGFLDRRGATGTGATDTDPAINSQGTGVQIGAHVI